MSKFAQAWFAIIWMAISALGAGDFHDKLADSTLTELLDFQDQTAVELPQDPAFLARLDLDEAGALDLWVVLTSEAELQRNALEQLGCQVLETFETGARVSTPAGSFRALLAAPFARAVYLYPKPVQDRMGGTGIVSEGFAQTGAAAYHLAHHRGSGVRIGLIDLQFEGLNLAATQQPAEVPTVPLNHQFVWSTNQYVNGAVEAAGAGVHGTACLEILYDLAPDAEYFLLRLGGGSLAQAIDRLTERQVDVISYSVGLNATAGPGNGKDPYGIDAAIRRAHDQGILVVASAGNHQRQTHTQVFTDGQSGQPDTWHDFIVNGANGLPTYDENLRVRIRTQDENNDGIPDNQTIYGTWSEWNYTQPSSTSTIQRYTLTATPENGTTVISQTSAVGGYPRVSLTVAPAQDTVYLVRIRRLLGTVARRITIQGPRSSEILSPRGGFNIFTGADSSYGLTIGAVDAVHLGLERYSAHGPTVDGRTKPDLGSYAGVLSFVYGRQWRGTSAATPHVAGMAALAIDAHHLTIDDLIDPSNAANGYFQVSALPRGSTRPNNETGWGLARLTLLAAPLVSIVRPTTASPALLAEQTPNQRVQISFEARDASSFPTRGLNPNDLTVRIGSQACSVLNLLEQGNQYALTILSPSLANGTYNLALTVQRDGFSGSAMVTGGILVDNNVGAGVDTMVVIDHSGSMSGTPLATAKNSASLFVDLMSQGDMIGVASYGSTATLNYELTTIQPPEPANNLIEDDMESGVGDFVGTGTWARTQESAYSGNWSWTDSPGGVYPNNVNSTLTLNRSLDLRALTHPALGFNHVYSTESCCDHGYVEISTNGGSSWTIVADYHGSSGTWITEEIDLAAYRNTTLKLRFRLFSDSSVTSDGWHIDDVRVGNSIQDVQGNAKNAIASIISDGGTSIGAGLQVAHNQLTTRGNQSHPWATVLLTDGLENTSPSVASVMPSILGTRNRLFTIGLGPTIDQALLSDIANQTNGQYFQAPTPSELANVYNIISGQVGNRETLLSSQTPLSTGQSATYSTQVDASITEAIFTASWTQPANVLSMTLHSPTGQVIDIHTTLSNVQISQGPTFQSIRILQPAPGIWTTILNGLNVVADQGADFADALAEGRPEVITDLGSEQLALARHGERTVETVSLQIQADTQLRMVCLVSQDHIQVGEAINLASYLYYNGSLASLDMVAEVKYPDGSQTVAAGFNDQGIGGDARVGDGVFGTRLDRTQQPGTYIITVIAWGIDGQGHPFQRERAFTVIVDPATDGDSDGMPDTWESRFTLEGGFGLDPFTADGALDQDLDGLTNLLEFRNGGDPLNSDTDGDGLQDGAEYQRGTLLAVIDTDGGGEEDGHEVAKGRDPLDPNDDISCHVSAQVPRTIAQGLNPIRIYLNLSCKTPASTWTWHSPSVGPDEVNTNPYSLPSRLGSNRIVNLAGLQASTGVTFQRTIKLLASANTVFRDYNRDGLNTKADLWLLAAEWNNDRPTGDDPDGDHHLTVLDMMYINLDHEP